MISDPTAAKLGLLVQYAMNMAAGARRRTILEPRPDPGLSPDWTVRAYIRGADATFHSQGAVDLGQETDCYGYLAESTRQSGSFVAVIRGIEGIVDWIEDAEFASVPCPGGGTVERSFWKLYKTLSLRIEGHEQDIVSGIVSVVGTGTLTVVGHSLGGALATYLTLALADPNNLAQRVNACFFASPQTGGVEFVWRFDRVVANYKSYNYDMDIVPRAPMGSAYATLPRTRWIDPFEAQARIRFDFHCHHQVLSYCAMLDFPLLDRDKLAQRDVGGAPCIIGSTIGHKTDFRQESMAFDVLRQLEHELTKQEKHTSELRRAIHGRDGPAQMARSAVLDSDILGDLSQLTAVLHDLLGLGYGVIGRYVTGNPEKDAGRQVDAPLPGGYYASPEFKARWRVAISSGIDEWLQCARVFVRPKIDYIVAQSESLARGFSATPLETIRPRHALALIGKDASATDADSAVSNIQSVRILLETDAYCEDAQKFIDSMWKRMLPFSQRIGQLDRFLEPIDNALTNWTPVLAAAARQTPDDVAWNSIERLQRELKELRRHIRESAHRVDKESVKWLMAENLMSKESAAPDKGDLATNVDAVAELKNAIDMVQEARNKLQKWADGKVKQWTADSAEFFTKNAKTLLGLGSGILLVLGVFDVYAESLVLPVKLLDYSNINDLIIRGALVVPFMVVAAAPSLMVHVAGKIWTQAEHAKKTGLASMTRFWRTFIRVTWRISPEVLLSIPFLALIVLMPSWTVARTYFRVEHIKQHPGDTSIYMSNAAVPWQSSGILEAMSNYLFAYGTGRRPAMWIVPSAGIRCIEDGKGGARNVGTVCSGGIGQNGRTGPVNPFLGASVRQYVREAEGCIVPEDMPILSVGFAFNESRARYIRSWFYYPADNPGFKIVPRDPLLFRRIEFVQSPKGLKTPMKDDLIKEIKEQLSEVLGLIRYGHAQISSLLLVGLSSQRGRPTNNQVLANERIETVESLLKGMHIKHLPTIRRRALGVNVLTGRGPRGLRWLDQRVAIVACGHGR